MSFPRYPAYKDSGLEWLGEVPEHWEGLRLRFAAMLNPSKQEARLVGEKETVSFLPMEAIGEDGSLILEQEKEIGECLNGYTYFKEGDVCIAKITPCFENGKGAILRDLKGGIGFGTTELIVARPRTEIVKAQFLDYLFRSSTFRSLGEAAMYGAGGQKRVPDSFVRDFASFLPPIAEQSAISAFLDRETAKIDALIAEQQRLIELLQEKRQAVISHAVTKGLNPDAPMKDSGVAWLGEVPQHWEIMGLTKAIGPVVDYRGRTPTKCDSGTLLVTAKNIRNGEIDYSLSEEYVDPVEAEELLQRGRPGLGDVLFTMEAPLGQVALVDREDIALAQRVVKFRAIRDRMTNSYLMWWLVGSHCQYQLNALSTGSTALGIKASKLSAVTCIVPPISEQQAIDARIRDFTAQFSSIHAVALDQIELLQERRSALISAAVTGQIDVRGLVPEASTA
jgi:type I restriction enzyme S subunit